MSFATPLWLVASAALLAGASVSAGQAEPPENEGTSAHEINVLGDRVLEDPVIVKDLRKLTIREKFSQRPPRFYDPLCPRVVGLDAPLAALVEARIRANAEFTGLAPASANCRPNGIVMVIDQPAVMFEQLYRKRPSLVGTYELRDNPLSTIRSELAAGRPVVSWSQMSQRPTNGILQSNLDEIVLRTNTTPRLRPTVTMKKETAVVLFDRRQLVDVEVNQLADFASLHLLGGPRPGGDGTGVTVPTLMTLFRDGPNAAPTELTEFDRAYLLGLHAIPGEALGKPLAAKVLALYAEQCAQPGGTCELSE